MTIEGIGTISVGEFVLKNVAYVPGLPVNLLSFQAANKSAGLVMCCSVDGVTISSISGSYTIHGYIKNGIYMLNSFCLTISDR